MSKKEEEQKAQYEQEQVRKIRLPRREEREMFGVVTQLHGSSQVKVLCEDGIERNCRIPGKMRKRTWLKNRDTVIVKLWEIQPSKADITWRFIGVQTEHLKRRGLLTKLPV